MKEEVNHAERAHAEFGPSSLKYVSKCAGYTGRSGTNAAAEMGTRIHEALEIRDPSALHNEEEIAIYDRIYAEELEVFDNVYGGEEGVTIQREMRLVLDLDCKTPTFGTSDIVAWKGDIGLQIDYKTGISRIDEPRDNWQAKAYVLAAFQMQPHLNVIHFAFLIPRREEILVGTFNRSEMEKLRNEISNVISIAEVVRPMWENGSPDIDHLTPSVNCRFCKFEDRCPALGAVAIEVAKRARPDLLPEGDITPSNLNDPETIEQLYAIAKIVETWASSLKFRAVQMANAGVEFETLKLRSLGALKKTSDKNGLAQLAIQHGLELSEVIEAADLTLTKLSKAIYDKAAKGKKSFAVDTFELSALNTGLVDIGDVRYTLASR